MPLKHSLATETEGSTAKRLKGEFRITSGVCCELSCACKSGVFVPEVGVQTSLSCEECRHLLARHDVAVTGLEFFSSAGDAEKGIRHLLFLMRSIHLTKNVTPSYLLINRKLSLCSSRFWATRVPPFKGTLRLNLSQSKVAESAAGSRTTRTTVCKVVKSRENHALTKRRQRSICS
jgi:hypothetical protein